MTSNREEKTPVRGLEGVIAGETKSSYVDGVHGFLIYNGYNIHELAEKVTFAEVVHLLWYDRLPTSRELASFRAQIVSEMRLPSQVIDLIGLAPPNAHPMDVLRTAVSALSMFDPDSGNMSPEANRRKCVRYLRCRRERGQDENKRVEISSADFRFQHQQSTSNDRCMQHDRCRGAQCSCGML